MNLNNSLKKKNNDRLISDLKTLVANEREVLTQILHTIREVEARKLYLAKGFATLFAFMTQFLGYSESAAQRRIQAMRLIKDIPEVEVKIESGKMSLTVAAQVQSFIRRENQKRKEDKVQILEKSEKLDLIKRLEGTSTRDCERKLIEMAPETALPKEKTRPLTANKHLIQFVADIALMNKIERLKSLLSHQNPEGKYEQLFSKAIEIALEKLDPEKREARRENRREKMTNKKTNQSLPAPAIKSSSRYIPQKIKDRVYLRDQGRCQYRDPDTGLQCASKYLLQVDHRYPHALSGENAEQNLRLLCQSHNQYKSEEIFGRVHRVDKTSLGFQE